MWSHSQPSSLMILLYYLPVVKTGSCKLKFAFSDYGKYGLIALESENPVSLVHIDITNTSDITKVSEQ